MTQSLVIPARLAETCRETAERRAWLERLPQAVCELTGRWALSLEEPFDAEASCAWVAPATRRDGTRAVLKLGMPHMEGEHEILGLRAWAGDPTVLLLDSDEERNAMLLERCEPGTHLRELPEPEQDVILAGLLRRLWRVTPPASFRPLAAMTTRWANEASAKPRHVDPVMFAEAVRLFDELSRPARGDVLLATDLHAGNVLRAEREPWLVIDPKPFVGDPAYDATQHLLNCKGRLQAAPDATITSFAELLGVSRERVRLWTFARAVLDFDGALAGLARALRVTRAR